MGYTGNISLNGKTIFSEWKSNNTNYCMNYPMVYLRKKPCLLTVDAIKEARETLLTSNTGYDGAFRQVRSSMKVIDFLMFLMDRFVEDDVFTGVLKLQNHDTYGNSQSIYVYRKKNVSNVPSATYNERSFLELNLLNDVKSKSLKELSCLSIFSMYDNDSARQNQMTHMEEMVDSIMNIQNRYDILNLIKEAERQYVNLHKVYVKKYEQTMDTVSLLDALQIELEAHQQVTVSYENNELKTVSEGIERSAAIDFHLIADLFKKNGITGYGAEVTLTNKEDFKAFIECFSEVEQRGKNFEKILLQTYYDIQDNETFVLSISGSY